MSMTMVIGDVNLGFNGDGDYDDKVSKSNDVRMITTVMMMMKVMTKNT